MADTEKNTEGGLTRRQFVRAGLSSSISVLGWRFYKQLSSMREKFNAELEGREPECFALENRISNYEVSDGVRVSFDHKENEAIVEFYDGGVPLHYKASSGKFSPNLEEYDLEGLSSNREILEKIDEAYEQYLNGVKGDADAYLARVECDDGRVGRALAKRIRKHTECVETIGALVKYRIAEYEQSQQKPGLEV